MDSPLEGLASRCHKLSGFGQIDHFRCPISWLVEANSPVPDEKWLNFHAWIWSNLESSRWAGHCRIGIKAGLYLAAMLVSGEFSRIKYESFPVLNALFPPPLSPGRSGRALGPGVTQARWGCNICVIYVYTYMRWPVYTYIRTYTTTHKRSEMKHTIQTNCGPRQLTHLIKPI